MKVPTVSQEIVVMAETARGGEPAQIIASIEERLADYVAIPEATASSKVALRRYAQILIDLVRSGDLPERVRVCQDCGAPASLVVSNQGNPIRTVCGDCAGRYTWRSHLSASPIAAPGA